MAERTSKPHPAILANYESRLRKLLASWSVTHGAHRKSLGRCVRVQCQAIRTYREELAHG